MKKAGMCILLVLSILILMLSPVLTPPICAADDSGTCGVNAEWSFSGNTLIISGAGDMDEYLQVSDVPWHEYRFDIKYAFISEDITSIGQYAFTHCNGLNFIEIPQAVVAIGESAFEGCSSLTYINIPRAVAVIGESTFKGCSGLTYINIPSTVVTIGESAFEGCSNVSHVSMIDGDATSIGVKAFANCQNLISIPLPDTMESIGALAFENCTSLAPMILPNGIKSIGTDAFKNCSSFKIFGPADSYFETYAKSSQVPFAAVADNGTYLYAIEDGHATIVRYHGWGAKTLIIPDSLGGCPVTSIDSFAYMNSVGGFSHDINTTSVIVPNGVTHIGYGAFSYFSVLTSITIPDSVVEIGESAFAGRERLESITIPENVKIIGDYAFTNCIKLPSITIPDSVEYIGKSAFSRCDGLTEIAVPGSVIDIGQDAFRGCVNVTSLSITDGVKTIADGAFRNCISLPTVAIPDSVVQLGPRAFLGCVSLITITLPSDLTEISDAVFYGCTSLSSITLPDSIDRIGWSAFYECGRLSAISVPHNVTALENGAFYACRNLTTVVFHNPDTSIVTSDGGYSNKIGGSWDSIVFSSHPTFEGCSNLTDIHGYVNSTAEAFAKERGKTFLPMVKVLLNGTQLFFDVRPQIIQDRTMVPMRKIFADFDMDIEWDNATKMVTATRGDTVITMQIGNPVMMVNEIAVTLDVVPQLVESRTLVPLRAVSEGLHADVQWDAETKTVTIAS